MEHRFNDEWLVRPGLTIPGITQSNINLFRTEKVASVEDALLQRKLTDRETLAKAISAVYNVPCINLEFKNIDRLALSLVPEKVCRRNFMIPFRVRENFIDVAMTCPIAMDAVSDVQLLTGRQVVPHYCAKQTIDALLVEIFSGETVIFELIEQMGENSDLEILESENSEHVAPVAEDIKAPVIKLVNSIISKAVKQRASDIHVEQSERLTEVRYRIDGILKNIMTVPKKIGAGALVARIKIMADLDIANHMKPQDGRAKVKVAGKEIGLRVSTLPTNYGEKVVMRILDPKSAERSLAEMGFGSNNIARLDTVVQSSQGMIIVTGPTGSGKTTTLYAVLNKLKSETTNIVTVEDPIEYKLKGINQVQVNEKQGLGFSNILRSVLRQDPDIILVGEMRDAETASIAFQASLTGHLVFSTLHTNDTISTLSRLVDMGVERFKIAPALLAITSQRLVRQLCPSCRQSIPNDERDSSIVGLLKNKEYEGTYFKSVGCESCQFSGYSGRLALLEILQPTRELREKIGAGADEGTIRQLALSKKVLQTMLDDALWHLSRGDTTLEEITPYVNLDDQVGPAEEKVMQPAVHETVVLESVVPEVSLPSERLVENVQVEKNASVEPVEKEIPISNPKVIEPLESPVILQSPSLNEHPPRVNPTTVTPPKSNGMEEQISKPKGPAKILVVDDDETIRIMMKVILENAGFGVIEAEDGKSAILKVLHDGPDLMVLDLNMPKMGGHAAIQFLRNETSGTQIPIIVLTTESDEINQMETFKAGANDYLVKPLSPSLVIARVKAALRRKEIFLGR